MKVYRLNYKKMKMRTRWLSQNAHKAKEWSSLGGGEEALRHIGGWADVSPVPRLEFPLAGRLWPVVSQQCSVRGGTCREG